MRVISEPVKTYSLNLTSGLQVQPSQVLPNFGPLQGLYLDLTVSLAGATASQASNSIDNVLSHFAIDDQYGKSIADLLGTDLSVINDMLTPRGVRQAAPTISTNTAGAGSAEWFLFLPLTISHKDMPGVVRVTFNSISSLQNGSLTSAGTPTVTLVLRAAYSVGVDQPTLRIQVTNPPNAQGDNAIGPYLPTGFQIEALGFVLTGGDADFGYLTVFQGGATFASLMPLNDFKSQDVMLMQSGHLSGEFICRFPVFVVDSTTVVTLNESTSTAIRVYSIATIPQKREG